MVKLLQKVSSFCHRLLEKEVLYGEYKMLYVDGITPFGTVLFYNDGKTLIIYDDVVRYLYIILCTRLNERRKCFCALSKRKLENHSIKGPFNPIEKTSIRVVNGALYVLL